MFETYFLVPSFFLTLFISVCTVDKLVTSHSLQSLDLYRWQISWINPARDFRDLSNPSDSSKFCLCFQSPTCYLEFSGSCQYSETGDTEASILEARRKIRILHVCYNPFLPSHGRSWEIGFSSQLHGAMSGVGFMEREYHKYPYCFNVAHFVLAWDAEVSISFWILHKLNHSMYCCWISVWGGGGRRSSIFYSAICLPSLYPEFIFITTIRSKNYRSV